MSTVQQDFRINNFNLLRLFAALQVALHHSTAHMNLFPAWKEQGLKGWLLFSEAINLIPGVPIFFFISGFLISRSFENNAKLSEYALNRILRIYPGLIVCVALSILSVAATGYLHTVEVNVWNLLVWFLAKISIVQFYNPSFMRGYGVGVVNGSLWSICVELQFYVLIPIIYRLLHFKSKDGFNNKLLMPIGLFLVINRVYFYYESEYQFEILYKLVGISFLPWFYMFLVGMYFQRNYTIMARYLSGKFGILFPTYCIFAIIMNKYLGLAVFNDISPALFVPLSCVIFSFAFTWRTLSRKMLKSSDISYGIYVYHMPVVNFMLYLGYSGQFRHVLIVLAVVFGLAILSWRYIEKPCLKLKKKPFNPIVENAYRPIPSDAA